MKERFGYHCTETDPEKIKKEGWKVGKGFTQANIFEDLYKEYLPKVPVFISNEDAKVWDSRSSYCFKLDFSKLDIYPDFGSLVDYGAMYDSEFIYWEDEESFNGNDELRNFVLENCDDLTMDPSIFTGEDSLRTLGTCCLDGNALNKLKNRGIVAVKSSKKLNEDKSAMIKKLVLPDLQSNDEKEATKEKILQYFKKHPSSENKIDWNKWKTLTSKDFDIVINDVSRTAVRKGAKSGDPKEIFKSTGKRKFLFIDETDNWYFTVPLTFEAAHYCDSVENQGAGAKWCIGQEISYWNDYINDGYLFILAFNKNFMNLSDKEKKTKTKYMLSYTNEDEEGRNLVIWNQQDKDFGMVKPLKDHENRIIDMFLKLEELVNNEKVELETGAFQIEGDVLKQSYRKYDNGVCVVPDGIATIGANAFDSDIRLEKIVIPETVKKIDRLAFNRSALENIEFKGHSNLRSIETAAFFYSEIKKLELPNKLMKIGRMAFSDNPFLEEVTIPSSVKYIGESAFSRCENLKKVTLPKMFKGDVEDPDGLLILGKDWKDIDIQYT